LSTHPANPTPSIDLELAPADNAAPGQPVRPFDGHLRLIERRLGIEISNRGVSFRIIGERDAVTAGERCCATSMPPPPSETLSAEVHLHLQHPASTRCWADRASTCPRWSSRPSAA
jgi:phosphate starvation-inducible protein PhoH